MKKLPIILCSFFFLATGIDFAIAKTFNVKAKAGVSTSIGAFVLTEGRSCRGMHPGKAKLRTAPKNGKIRLERTTWRPKSGRCKGYSMPAWNFIYRGNGKSDYVVITVTTSRYAGSHGTKTWYKKYKINQ